MTFNLLVLGSLYSSQSGYSAWRFANAAIQAGHEISQVFFYQDAVAQANQLSNPLSDEFDVVGSWQLFAQVSEAKLVVCIAAAERRGVMSDAIANEFNDCSGNLASGFEIAGLGALQQAMLDCDRTVTFV